MASTDAIQLRDPDVIPDEDALRRVLSESFPVYCRLLELFDECGLTHEWRYYRDGSAWLCKVQRKAKTIVWMSAWDGYVKATVYVPEKHAEGLFALDIPADEKHRIRDTKNVGKSKPCSFEMKTDDVLPVFEKLLRYKLEAK